MLTKINDEGRTFEFAEVSAAPKTMSTVGWGTDYFVNPQRMWPVTVMRSDSNHGEIQVGATVADLANFGDDFYHA